MKINYELNDDNTIKQWVAIPFNPSLAYIEVEDPYLIKCSYDKIIKGKLVKDEVSYNNYLENQKSINDIQTQIFEVEHQLSSTDYKILKYIEGNLSEEEYSSIKVIRQQYRDTINKLKSSLSLLEEESGE